MKAQPDLFGWINPKHRTPSKMQKAKRWKSVARVRKAKADFLREARRRFGLHGAGSIVWVTEGRRSQIYGDFTSFAFSRTLPKDLLANSYQDLHETGPVHREIGNWVSAAAFWRHLIRCSDFGPEVSDRKEAK